MSDEKFDWFEIAKKLKAISQTGKHFAKDDFERRRHEDIARIAAEILGRYTENLETEQVQLTLRTLYALVPSACNVIAFVIVLAYTIRSRVHEQIRSAIVDRRDGKPVADPLQPQRMIS